MLSGADKSSEFISSLTRELVTRGGYIRGQNGIAVKKTNYATNVVLFAYNTTDIRISNEAEPSPSVLYTIICVKDKVYDTDMEKLQAFTKEDRNRGVLTEYIVVDTENDTYMMPVGRKPSDKALSEILNETLSGKVPKQRVRQSVKRKPLFTEPGIILIVINVLIFAVGYMMQLKYGYDPLKEAGIMNPAMIRGGEYWRLFTCMFLHGDIVHLFGNMYFLFILTQYLRFSHGRFKFCVQYFLSGLAGSFLSFMFSNASSLGASGAIMGMGGALVARMIILRKNGNYGVSSYMNIIIMIGFNLVYGLFVPGIDNWGHFGGFAMGFVIELLTYLFSKKERTA